MAPINRPRGYVVSDEEYSNTFKNLFGNKLTAKEILTFTTIYFEDDDGPEAFWEKIKASNDFDDKKIEVAKKLLAFNMIFDNHPQMAGFLYDKQATDPNFKHIRCFANNRVEDWQRQLAEAKISTFPNNVVGKNTTEKIEIYAAHLEQLFKNLYPTPFFSARMQQDKSSSFAQKEQLKTFFDNNPEFDLKTKIILLKMETANFGGITNKGKLKNELKIINNLYKITDDYKLVNALYSKKLFTSKDIVNKYKMEQFVLEFSSVIGAKEKLSKSYKKAISINNKTTALITAYKMRNDIRLN
jgi:hypothetical protein